MDVEGVVAAPGGPLMRAGGNAEEFGDGVGVSGRGCERDEPGVGWEVLGHGIGLLVVVGFVGEEENGGGAVDKAVAQVPTEKLLEGLGAVLALPKDGFVEGGHFI
jgi:hypothetical protein